jgi:hypothetical protein
LHSKRGSLELSRGEKTQKTLRTHLTHFLLRSGLRGRPSPLCEGDRDQRWSDCGSVALSPFSFVFIFFILVLRLARLGCSSGRRDLLRLLMSGGHRVWVFIPVRVFSDYPNLRVDYSKLFLVKSPCHTRIVWQNRFDLLVACLAGIKDPNLLRFQTLVAVVVLEIYWIGIKFCAGYYVFWVVCCCFSCCWDVSVVNYVVLVVVAALCVGSFAALCVGLLP